MKKAAGKAGKHGERWGRKFVDRRDWREYSRQLVERGRYFIDLDFVENWDSELAVMNCGKVGPPFQYPNSLIELQAVWHAKSIPFRMIQGITKEIVKFGRLPAAEHYSVANRRMNRLSLKMLLPEGDSLFLFSDGTGVQAKSGGEYLRELYGKKNRCFIQVVILGEPGRKEPVSFEVHLVRTSEAESALRQLDALEEQGVDIAGFGGDGSFDDFGVWDYIESRGWAPAVKPDKNAVTDSKSRLRNQQVKERNRLLHKKWARKRHYGDRWPGTEGIFSAVKRIFGEEVTATSRLGMIKQAGIKFWAYQRMKRFGEAA